MNTSPYREPERVDNPRRTIALLRTDGTEPDGGGYKRVTWDPSSSATVWFPRASATWGTIVALRIWTEDGEFLNDVPLKHAKTIMCGDAAGFEWPFLSEPTT